MNFKQTINSAMKKDNWTVYAGGTGAPGNTYAYSYVTTFGEYIIQPVSSVHNANKLAGYVLYFLNTKAIEAGGLWQRLQMSARVSTAMAMAKQHAYYMLSKLPMKYQW